MQYQLLWMKVDMNGMLNPMVAIGIGFKEAVVSGLFTKDETVE